MKASTRPIILASIVRMRAAVLYGKEDVRIEEVPASPLRAGEVRVAIGSEHHLEPLRDCSLVVGRYGQDSDVVGFVGVVGPTRMDYARSIGAVRYVGSLMGDLVRVMEGQ